MRLLFACNDPDYWFAHRAPMAELLRQRGHNVSLVCGTPEPRASSDKDIVFAPLHRFALQPRQDLAFARTFLDVARQALMRCISSQSSPCSMAGWRCGWPAWGHVGLGPLQAWQRPWRRIGGLSSKPAGRRPAPGLRRSGKPARDRKRSRQGGSGIAWYCRGNPTFVFPALAFL